MNLIRYVLRHRHWPSKMQRDFMSRKPARRARVERFAAAILTEIEAEEAERRNG